MNTNERFDELARQKLEQRTFPFEEGAWLEAEAAIAAARGRRKSWLPYAAGSIAVLIAAWLLWPAEQENRIATVQPGKGAPAVQESAPPPPAIVNEVVDENENVSGSPHEAVVESVAISSEVAPRTASHARVNHDRPVVVQSSIQNPKLEPSRRADEMEVIEHAAEPETPSTTVEGGMLPPVAEPTEPDAVPTTTTTGMLATPPPPIVSEEPDADAQDAPDEMVLASEVRTGEVVTEEVAAPLVVEPNAEMTTGEEAGAPAAIIPVVAGTEPPAPQDSLPAAGSEVAATPTPTPVAPPIVPANSPWEITALGGIFQTNSAYTGGESEMWNVDKQRTAGFGAEIMHMGRNIGLGIGLHYGTYADRLTTPEQRFDSYQYDPYWYLALIDTTILIITDTIEQNGQVVYVGHSVYTSVPVLRAAVDTTVTTTVRQASERVNRTSYFEVPFLFNAHLVQGRWSIGTRLGPTVGLLTTRQGSLPAEGGEGEAGFNDLVMRDYIWGWTARAYVRYRFNSAWSVGIEPAARGQLQDGFDKQFVSRRSNAVGCMVSLSYRLR